MDTDYKFMIAEGLEKYNRYRDRLSVLDDAD